MDEETNELIVPLEEKEVIQDRATTQWFGNSDWFDGLEDGNEVDQSNIDQILKDKKKEKKQNKETNKKLSLRNAEYFCKLNLDCNNVEYCCNDDIKFCRIRDNGQIINDI